MFQEKLNRLSIENLLCDVLGCQELKLYHVVIYYDWCYFLGAQKNKNTFWTLSHTLFCDAFGRQKLKNIGPALQSMLVDTSGCQKREN